MKTMIVGSEIDLVCPACKQLLTDARSCAACQTSFQQRDGILYFVSEDVVEQLRKEESADKENAFKNFFKRWPTFYQWCIRLVAPVLFTGLTARQFCRRFTGQELILNVGSGATVLHPRSVNMDMFPFPNVHVIASAEALPFANGTFDVVCSEEVMEHVRHPHIMAAEMQRVAKPGGLIYVSLPFMFPDHPSPKDYWRCTVDGLRTLFEGCEEVESGVHSGPISGMLIILAGGLATICSLGSRTLQKIFNYVFMIVLSPIKLLDLYYAHTPAANIIASGVYIVVRKPF